MIPMPYYGKIRNNCCLVYLGDKKTTIQQIIDARKTLKITFPELAVYICISDQQCYLCEGLPRIFPLSMLSVNKSKFSFMQELNDRNLPNFLALLTSCGKK